MSGAKKKRLVGVSLTPEEYERLRALRSHEFESMNGLARRLVLDGVAEAEARA